MSGLSPEHGTLAVVVVNYNSHDLLATCLAPSHLEELPARIVVVDNSDARDQAEATVRLCQVHSWEYVATGGNGGFGAGVNAGVRRAAELGSSEFIILNPDAWMDQATAQALGERCARRPLEALSPVVRRPDGRAWFSRGEILMRRGRVTGTARERPGSQVTWLSGAAMVISRELWDLVGGFDERYFLYWEDVDLSWRISRVGGALAVVDELSAYHMVGATQPGSHKSAAYVYYNSRNRLLFAGTHLTPAQRRGWLLGTPRATWDFIRRGGRTSGAFWAGIRGAAVGLPYLVGIRRLGPQAGG